MIDLSALDVLSTAVEPAASGKPLEIPLSDIDKDPEQPRKEFSNETMADMVASIIATGVRTPVSVRPHPIDTGRYMLNFGARRYRASVAAGRKTIPAFVDEQHSDYDQVIENLQREALTPMELAMFIKRKQSEGSKPADIAKRLGKQKAVITYHQSLINAPAIIERAYSSGQCISPRTLYELRNLYEKHPRKVEAWAETMPEISRASIAELALQLKLGAGRTDKAVTTKTRDEPLESIKRSSAKPENVDADRTMGESHNSQAEGASNAGDDEITDPAVIVSYEGKSAVVLLERTPSSAGLIHIKFEDGSDAEVLGQACKITGLYDAVDSPIPL